MHTNLTWTSGELVALLITFSTTLQVVCHSHEHIFDTNLYLCHRHHNHYNSPFILLTQLEKVILPPGTVFQILKLNFPSFLDYFVPIFCGSLSQFFSTFLILINCPNFGQKGPGTGSLGSHFFFPIMPPCIHVDLVNRKCRLNEGQLFFSQSSGKMQQLELVASYVILQLA